MVDVVDSSEQITRKDMKALVSTYTQIQTDNQNDFSRKYVQ